MNKKQIETDAAAIIDCLRTNPPATFKTLAAGIEAELVRRDVPYAERRLVAMEIANTAEALAPAASGKSAEILAKIASYALDVHDRWARCSFFTRGPRNATREELLQLAREGRQFEALAEVVKNGVEALTLVARALPALPNTYVTVQPSTAPEVKVQVDAEVVLKATELKTLVDEAVKPETTTGNGKKTALPKRLGPAETEGAKTE